MGFEVNAAALLLKMKRDGVRLGRTLTLGHQHLHLSLAVYRRLFDQLALLAAPDLPVFADPVLRALGATDVEAMDVADYEGATRLHDLNALVPEAWHEQFDLVLDGGTLEHIFDFPMALKNCMQMIKPGGRFVAVTVPNNWCGHGFYQFSPELFFRTLGAANGFSTIEMYVADLEGRRQYRVRDPESVGSRVEFWSCDPLMLLVHARRDDVKEIFRTPPQQSDYVQDWKTGTRMGPPPREPAWKQLAIFRPIRRVRRAQLRRRHRRWYSLDNRAFFQRVDLGF